MIVSGAFLLLGLLAADVAAEPAGAGVAPLLVVRVASDTGRAMEEAISRLRGEATSVGFEVRVLGANAGDGDSVSPFPSGVEPAAVVTLSRVGEGSARHAVDVTFFERASGRSSSVHLVAQDAPGDPERSDVVVAVRAVEFIRARMADTLARGKITKRVAEPNSAARRAPRVHLGLGAVALASGSGFVPAVAPRIDAGFRPARWLHLGLTAFGLGTRPRLSTSVGGVSIDARYVGVTAAVLGREWHRMRPVFELGGGEHWLVVRGDADDGYLDRTTTLSSPAATAALGLSLRLTPALALDGRAGTLWLRKRARLYAPAENQIASVGRPMGFLELRLVASF